MPVDGVWLTNSAEEHLKTAEISCRYSNDGDLNFFVVYNIVVGC